MREFAKREIGFTFVKVNDRCEQMIKVMQENYDPTGNKMNVTDLSTACATKTQAEVTKEFVAAASFILSAAVGGGDSKGGKAPAKVARTSKPLWDPKQFEVKQWFSQRAYLQVQEISGNRITVKNSYDQPLYVSRDILEGMYSADHYKSEVAMNLTGLAELLLTVQDHVFTVGFRKQPSESDVADQLQAAEKATFSDPKKLG